MTITIGTDCSGIEAPIEALKQLGIPFVHKWACEKDKFARMSIMANYEPEVMYTDITERDHSQLPDVDLYVCGFPCQPFSTMGRMNGTKDPRGNIMMECIDVIKVKQPPVFILENVKNFKFIEGGKPFRYLIDTLGRIKDEHGNPLYSIVYDVYNTMDYGIPQRRQRLYVVGIKRDIQMKDFTKPMSLQMKPLDDFIIDKTVHIVDVSKSTIIKRLERIDFKAGFVFSNSNYVKPRENMCPTLTSQGSHHFYHSTYHRYLTPRECLMLQGFSCFNQVVSNTQLYKQIGNSMSVNVLSTILERILDVTLFKYFLKN